MAWPPVEQDPVGGLAEDAQGWPVAGADGQLGPVCAERAELEVGVQPGAQAPSRPTGSQVSGSEVMEGKRTGSPSAIATGRPSRPPSGPTPTAPSGPSPRAWALPATADSHPAGEPTSACFTTATGRGSSM